MNQVVIDFVAAINSRDSRRVIPLLADDHLFVDSQGNEIRGKKPVFEAWSGYFRFVPDYHISVEAMTGDKETWAVFGKAAGSFPPPPPAPGEKPGPRQPWSIPAAWKCTVRNGRVAEWRVYCDYRPLDAVLRSIGW